MTSTLQRLKADAEQRWETFTIEHPTAAASVFFAGAFSFGAVTAVAAPVLLAMSWHSSTGLQERNPFGLPPDQLALQPDTFQWTPQQMQDMTSAYANYSDVFARAARDDTSIQELPPLSSFPGMGNSDLTTLAANTDYVHNFDRTEYPHSAATVYSIQNLPGCLKFHPNDFAIIGFCSGSQVPQGPRMVRFTSREAGSSPLSTTTHDNLPIRNVDSSRTNYGFTMSKFVELHRVPITSDYFGGNEFDNLTLSAVSGFPFPYWAVFDPEYPSTLLFAHPGNVTKSTEYAVSVQAFNNGTSVGEMTIKPNVQLPSDPKKPTLNGVYSEWTPKRGYEYARSKYLRFGHWSVAGGRRLMYLRVHISPQTEKDNIWWIKILEQHGYSFSDPDGFTKLYGVPPNKGAASANICVVAVDSAGVESDPQCFEANPRRGPESAKKFFIGVGYTVAALVGTCFLRIAYGEARDKFTEFRESNRTVSDALFGMGHQCRVSIISCFRSQPSSGGGGAATEGLLRREL